MSLLRILMATHTPYLVLHIQGADLMESYVNFLIPTVAKLIAPRSYHFA